MTFDINIFVHYQSAGTTIFSVLKISWISDLEFLSYKQKSDTFGIEKTDLHSIIMFQIKMNDWKPDCTYETQLKCERSLKGKFAKYFV